VCGGAQRVVYTQHVPTCSKRVQVVRRWCALSGRCTLVTADVLRYALMQYAYIHILIACASVSELSALWFSP